MHLLRIYFLLLIAAPGVTWAAVAVNVPPIESVNKGSQPPGKASASSSAPIKQVADNLGWLSTKESALSIGVLLFGVFLTIQQSIVIVKRSFQPGDVIKMFGLTFIVISTLFIITAGYSSEQIAPAMGLFGTLAGYILGRTQSEKGDDQKN